MTGTVRLTITHEDVPFSKRHTIEMEVEGHVGAPEGSDTEAADIVLTRRQVAALAHKLITTLEGE